MVDQRRQSDASDTTAGTTPSGPVPASTPKPRRRWHQFSLRTLLVVMVVLMTIVGWVGWRMKRARANREWIAGRVAEYGPVYEYGLGDPWSCTKTRRPRTWLEEWFDDPGSEDDPTVVVAYASLYGVRVLDAELKGLNYVEKLWLVGPEINDSHLLNLKKLSHLEELWLIATNITDTGLEQLKGSTNLKKLILMGVPDNPADRRTLISEHLSHLSFQGPLDFGRTQITDAGLAHLKGLTNLQELKLIYTPVTDEGIADLRRALPNCNLYIRR